MIVTLINGPAQWTEDYPVSALAWQLPGSGQPGKATVFVPGSSPGASRTYIDTTGGLSRVHIADADLGEWDGFVKLAQGAGGGGLTLQCEELSGALAAELAGEGTFTGLTAGTLALEAYRRAFGGQSNPPVVPGTFADAPPVLLTYSFGGRTLLDVLSDLSQQTGQGWSIAGGRLSWGVPQGRAYEAYLCDDADVLVTDPPTADYSGLLKAVTARATGATGGSFTATAPENAGRPGAVHSVVSVSGDDQSDAAIQRAAETALALGRTPAITEGLQLRRNRAGSAILAAGGGTLTGPNVLPLWLPVPFTPTVITGELPEQPRGREVREGDTLTICLPGALAGGLVARWRVLARQWLAATPDFVGLTVQYQRPLLAETLQAYAVRPHQPIVQPAERNVVRRLINLSNDLRRIQAAG
jgi:hypothetical protein